MKEIKLYKSPFKALKLFALTLPFVAGGIWMILKEDSNKMDYIMGWTSACFFGLCIPVGFLHLFDRRPQIIINETGIFDRTTHYEFINWEIIRDAYLINIHGQKFISLEVDDRFKPSRKRGKIYKGAARFSEAVGAQELNISLGQIKIDEAKLTEFIRAMSTTDKSRKEKIIKTLPNIV